MKKIICALKPFVIKQAMCLYEDDKEINTTFATFTSFATDIYNLAKENNVKYIYLFGNTQLIEGLLTQLPENHGLQIIIKESNI